MCLVEVNTRVTFFFIPIALYVDDLTMIGLLYAKYV
jgi:hypothetical protein